MNLVEVDCPKGTKSTPLNDFASYARQNAIVRGKINANPSHRELCGSIGEEYIELCQATEGESEHLPGYTEVEEELVDILISCLTSLSCMGTDIDKAVGDKMKFNESRIINQKK